MAVAALDGKDRLLDVAARLFYRKGVGGVGINEIVETARVSKLTLYKHFPSKEILVEEMLAAHSDRIHAWIRREVELESPGPYRVLAVFDLLTDWFGEPGYSGCAVINAVTDTRSAAGVGEVARRHLMRYRSLLEELIIDAEVDDPSGTARVLLLLIEGASVVATIDSNSPVGLDARNAAKRLLGLGRT